MSSKLPPPFIRSLINDYGLEDDLLFKAIEDQKAITSVRLNPFKLINSFDTEEAVPWCGTGRYLTTRPDFTADPLWHAGCYYVQEASSMFLEQALKSTLNLNDQLRVLELFAASGGKSTLISSLISQKSLLVSNEIIKPKVTGLIENLNRWGPTNTFVSNNDPEDFKRLKSYFDVLIVDAPCSGSGISKNAPSAIDQWSESVVLKCSERQRRILEDVYSSLKVNGVLVYTTSTYSRQENEDIADWLCENFDLTPMRIPLDAGWGVEETTSEKQQAYGFRLYPHKLKEEVLFMACFRKNDKQGETHMKWPKRAKPDLKEDSIIKLWLDPKAELTIKSFENQKFALIPEHEVDYETLKANLNLKKAGTRIGAIKGVSLVPDQELAFSFINHPEIPRMDLTLHQALEYLKRNELKLETDMRGWILICYKGHVLGWAKALENRINNYYPKELRIKNQNTGI